jgi:hypothetical protein
MKSYNELIGELKNQSPEFRKARVWARIESTLEHRSAVSPMKMLLSVKIFPAMALCSLALGLMFTFSAMNHPGVEQLLSNVGSMNASPESFYEGTTYNSDL